MERGPEDISEEDPISENNPEREAMLRLEAYLKEAHADITKELDPMQKDRRPKERVTVAEDLRIEPSPAQYEARDKEFVERAFLRIHETANEKEVRAKQASMPGFQFELLKTAIMHKYAGERFIALRSSHYDDLANHVDNVSSSIA